MSVTAIPQTKGPSVWALAADLLAPEPPTGPCRSPAALAAYATRGFWQPAAHLEVLDQALLDIAEGRKRRLIVSMPPQHGKSQLTSQFFPAWYLGNYPDRQMILCSYEANLARSWGRRSRDVLEEFGPELFGVKVRSDSHAADDWNLAGRRGGLRTAGIGGPISGKPADVLVIDDPIKNAEEAASETIREKHWEWWQSVARARLQRHSAVIVVMTRWHENDLAGRLYDLGRFDSVVLPALAEDDDLLGRKLGEPLWPAMHDYDEIRQDVTTYWWEAMYQQRPSPAEGGLLKRNWWQGYDPFGWPQADEVATSWDLSFKQAGNSYVVGQVWIGNLANRYLAAQIRARMDFPETLEAVRALERWRAEHGLKAGRIYIEEAANGPAIISTLRNEIAGIVPVKAQGSKEARASAVAAQVESGNTYLPRGAIPAPEGYEPTPTDVLIDEAAAFPAGANDDQVDALSQALSQMTKRSGPRRKPRVV